VKSDVKSDSVVYQPHAESANITTPTASTLESHSFEWKLKQIREAVQNDEKKGGSSFNSFTLRDYVSDLLKMCEVLANEKLEMCQHRSILAQEVEKVWSICDNHVRLNEELHQQIGILKATNADLAEKNQESLSEIFKQSAAIKLNWQNTQTELTSGFCAAIIGPPKRCD
jgi:hypothetical protein